MPILQLIYLHIAFCNIKIAILKKLNLQFRKSKIAITTRNGKQFINITVKNAHEVGKLDVYFFCSGCVCALNTHTHKPQKKSISNIH